MDYEADIYSSNKQRLLYCVDLEYACAEIYKTLMQMFPKEGAFWNGLAMDEEFHAQFYLTADLLKFIEEFPDRLKLPPAVSTNKTLEFAERLQHTLRTRTLTLKEAMDATLLLEQSVVESYIFEFPEIDSPLIDKLKGIIACEQSHVEKIKSAMIARGFSKLD